MCTSEYSIIKYVCTLSYNIRKEGGVIDTAVRIPGGKSPMIDILARLSDHGCGMPAHQAILHENRLIAGKGLIVAKRLGKADELVLDQDGF